MHKPKGNSITAFLVYPTGLALSHCVLCKISSCSRHNKHTHVFKASDGGEEYRDFQIPAYEEMIGIT